MAGEEVKSTEHNVGLGELKASSGRVVLVTRALGSCIAVALYDRERKVGGLAHVMLPKGSSRSIGTAGKFADEAISNLLLEMKKFGCDGTVVAKIAGGSEMFKSKGSSIGTIGKNNIEMVKQVLRKMKVPVVASDVGGNKARSVFFDTETGLLMVRSVNGETRRM
ncbi:MAG: chemotaxis protein CheD [Actinobacteria bacterium]|nr:chemotaxis protein CheD [Actinomycetota bacterium]